MWGLDAPVVPPPTALKYFSIAVLGFVTFGFVVKAALVPDRPSIAREYPFDGLVKEFGGVEENKVREPVPISDARNCSHLGTLCTTGTPGPGYR